MPGEAHSRSITATRTHVSRGNYPESRNGHTVNVVGVVLSWPVARAAALERDEHRCRSADFGLTGPCSTFPPGLVVHHRNRRRGPDPHAIDMLITLCWGHHEATHRNVAESFESGLLQRSTS
jgi:hypothetical protein